MSDLPSVSRAEVSYPETNTEIPGATATDYAPSAGGNEFAEESSTSTGYGGTSSGPSFEPANPEGVVPMDASGTTGTGTSGGERVEHFPPTHPDHREYHHGGLAEPITGEGLYSGGGADTTTTTTTTTSYTSPETDTSYTSGAGPTGTGYTDTASTPGSTSALGPTSSDPALASGTSGATGEGLMNLPGTTAQPAGVPTAPVDADTELGSRRVDHPGGAAGGDYVPDESDPNVYTSPHSYSTTGSQNPTRMNKLPLSENVHNVPEGGVALHGKEGLPLGKPNFVDRMVGKVQQEIGRTTGNWETHEKGVLREAGGAAAAKGEARAPI